MMCLSHIRDESLDTSNNLHLSVNCLFGAEALNGALYRNVSITPKKFLARKQSNKDAFESPAVLVNTEPETKRRRNKTTALERPTTAEETPQDI